MLEILQWLKCPPRSMNLGKHISKDAFSCLKQIGQRIKSLHRWLKTPTKEARWRAEERTLYADGLDLLPAVSAFGSGPRDLPFLLRVSL